MKAMRFITILLVAVILSISAIGITNAGETADRWRSDVWDPKQERETAVYVRAQLQGLTDDLMRVVAEVQEIKDAGKLNTVDPALQVIVNRWFNLLKAAKTGIEGDAEIMDLMEFRP